MTVFCPACRGSFECQPEVPYGCPHCQSAVIGPYCDAMRIGSGAMGDVYRVRRPDLGNRIFALKMPKTNDMAARRRFDRESAATALLQHEAIVRAIDCGQVQGRDFLVMEYVDGVLLHELVRREHPLTANRVAQVLLSIASGLAHAGRRGIVNRDVKPENIMVLHDGTAKLLDFGLALIKSVDGAVDRTTQDGVRLGTIAFMAPEQALDPRDLSIAADVYALACTAFFALTGEPPFRGSNSEILRQHAEEKRPSLSTIRPDLPNRFCQLLIDMMAIDPECRPTPDTVASQLRDLLTQGIISASPQTFHGPDDTHAGITPETRAEEEIIDGELTDVESETPAFPLLSHGEEEIFDGEIVEGDVVSTSETQHLDSNHGTLHRDSLNASSSFADHVNSQDLRAADDASLARLDALTSGSTRNLNQTNPEDTVTAHFPWTPVSPVAFDDRSSHPRPVNPLGHDRGDSTIVRRSYDSTFVPSHASSDDSLTSDSLTSEERFIGWVGEDGSLDLAIRNEELIEGEILEESDIAAHLHTDDSIVTGEEVFPVEGSFRDTPSPHAMGPRSWEHSPLHDTLHSSQDDTDRGLESFRSGTSSTANRSSTRESAWDSGPAFDGGNPTATSAKKTAPAKRSKARTSRRAWLPKLIIGTLLMLIAGVGIGLYFALQPPPPDEQWQLAQDDFQLGKFTESEKHFTVFAERYPNDPRTAEIPFFQDLIPVAREIDSVTGDWNAGLKQLDQLFLKYRDEPVYEKYRADLFKYYDVLINRFLDQSKKKPAAATLALARQALSGLTTVGQSMPDDWVPRKVSEMTVLIDQQDLAVEQVGRKQAAVALLKPPEADQPADYDALYAKVEAFLLEHPELKSDREIQDAIVNLRQSELQRVTYESAVEHAVDSREEETPAGSNAPVLQPDGQFTYVVWDQPTEAEQTFISSEVQIALANGVLYAFDTDGRYLWARRLGVDSDRLPQRIRAAKNAPELFLAVSTLENSLDAIDTISGKTVWRYVVEEGETLAAPLTICRWKPEPHRPEKVRGLLASTSGDVHVLELVRGQTLGRFRTGVPMTNTGGVFDPTSQLVYMPADSKRFFALDPSIIEGATTNAARSILNTGHASGSIRSQPVVVGPYLVTIESADLDHTVVRAFRLHPTHGFENPEVGAVKTIKLAGWAWFTPPVTADRLTVVTDTGTLGVLGLNLDNASEAIYPLIESNKDQSIPQLSVGLPQRAMAIHSDEHLLWLMAGGSLQKLRLDILKQDVKTAWSSTEQNSPVKGLPLHPAAFDLEQQRIYLTTRSQASEQVIFSAVDAEQGDTLWQRQLGFYPAIDPISLSDGSLLLIDRSGRFLLARAVGPADQQTLELHAESLPALEAIDGPPQLIQDETGQSYLTVSLRAGRALGLRSLSITAEGNPWRIIDLPEGQLRGRPTILADHLVCVAANPGQPAALFRIPLAETSPAKPDPYRWPQATVLTNEDEVQLQSLEDNRVLLAVGNALHWLQWDSSGVVPTWKASEGWFYSRARLTGPVIGVGQRVYAVDRDHTLYRIQSEQPSESLQWSASEAITAGPFHWNDRLVVVEGGRSLVAFDTQSTSPDLLPVWRHRLLSGRICGRPVTYGNYLLVTDLAGGLTPIDLATGEARPRVSFLPGAAPAAASTLLGNRRILIPMADGTLLWQSLQPAREQAS